jgi:hypothetical protein
VFAALSELREARHELKASPDNWLPEQRDRARAAIDDAIGSLKGILHIRGDDWRGVARKEEFYRRYNNHPHLRRTLEDLREAADELRNARADFGALKERALRDIRVARENIRQIVER